MPRASTSQRRTEIADALLTVMTTRGYAGASIQVIAAQAGLSPGLVHYHFRSKEEILLTCLEQLAHLAEQRFDARCTGAVEPWHRLDAWIDAHLERDETTDPRIAAAWAVAGAEALRRRKVRDAYQAILTKSLDQAEQLVAALPRDPMASPVPSRAYAAALLAAIEGGFRIAAGAPDLLPAGSLASSVKKMARGLMAPQ